MADHNIKKKKIVAATFNSFDNLPDDIKINILCRIPVKLLARFTCFSKAWHYLITHSCFPIALPCSGILFHEETRAVTQRHPLSFWQFSLETAIEDFLDSASKFKVTAKEFLDCCNGLTLLCHCTMKAPSSQRLYYYYVVNPLTKQCVTVIKPCPKSTCNIYAALAYNPSESSYYKIVQFQGRKKLNIFSSDTGNWSSFGFELEKCITKATWVRQCVFHKGAIYRLSMSGHLLRFAVDKEVRASARAKAIELPEIARKDPKGCVGLKNGDINFAMSDGLNIRIWALQHHHNSTTQEYEWILKYTIPFSMIKDTEGGNSLSYQPLAFHPHSDIVFLGCQGCITRYHLSGKRLERDPLEILFWGLRVLVFPAVQCAAPFASSMLDERSAKKETDYFHQYRSNIVTVQALMRELKLTGAHKNALKKTPFWNFLQPFSEEDLSTNTRKHDKNVSELISTYNTSTKSFHLGKKRLVITNNEVKLIFGIACGTEKMEPSKRGKTLTPFVERRFSETERLTGKAIKEVLLETVKGKSKADVNDVARLVTLYLCITVFFATSGNSIGWTFIDFVEDLDGMKKFNWAEAIRKTLMSSISEHSNSPSKVTGCVMALLYWFCEHARILTPIYNNKFPRFLKWDLMQLNKTIKRKQIKRKQLSLLTAKEVVETELEATEDEKQLLREAEAEEEEEEEQEQEQEQEAAEEEEAVEEEEEEEEEEEDEEEEQEEAVEEEEEDEEEGQEVQQKGAEGVEQPDNVESTPTVHEVHIRPLYIDSVGGQSENLFKEMSEKNEKANKGVKELEEEKKADRNKILKLEEQIMRQCETMQMLQATVEALQADKMIKDLQNQVEFLNNEKSALSQEYLKYSGEKESEIAGLIIIQDDLRCQCTKLEQENKQQLQTNNSMQQTIKNLTPRRQSQQEIEAAGEGNLNSPRSARVTRSMIRGIKTKQRFQKEDLDFEYQQKVGEKRGRKQGKKAQDVETIDVEGFRAPPPKKKKKPFSWTKKCHVANMMSEEDKSLMLQIYNAQGYGATVWSSEGAFEQVFFADMVALMQEKDTSNNVIDSYAATLTREQNSESTRALKDIEGFIVNPSFFILSSTCLTYVREKNEAGLRILVDPHIGAGSLKYRYLIFPLHSDHHWTLLVLDSEEGLWGHYNSMRPRLETQADHYLEDAEMMKQYVEDYQRQHSSDQLSTQDVQRVILSIKDTPQQKYGSLDCAVICCYLMKQIATHQPIPKSLDQRTLRWFRIEMMHQFLNDGVRTWNLETANILSKEYKD